MAGHVMLFVHGCVYVVTGFLVFWLVCAGIEGVQMTLAFCPVLRIVLNGLEFFSCRLLGISLFFS